MLCFRLSRQASKGYHSHADSGLACERKQELTTKSTKEKLRRNKNVFLFKIIYGISHFPKNGPLLLFFFSSSRPLWLNFLLSLLSASQQKSLAGILTPMRFRESYGLADLAQPKSTSREAG
jgi:hypothetical protein